MCEFIGSTLDVQPSGHSSSFNVHSDTLIAEAFASFRQQCLDVWYKKVDGECVFTADSRGEGPLPMVFVKIAGGTDIATPKSSAAPEIEKRSI